jgi:hypothetical protein
MKLTIKTSRRAIGAAALAAILATAASAQSPSWPTPPAPSWPTPPAPQAESPIAPQAESSAAPEAEGAATPRTEPASQFSPARLGQMLAPIALYPDDLLADVLMAATYPLDVVEAARWLKDPQNAALKGDRLFQALQQNSWDASVKALAPFPHILRMLDANIEWTEQLGEAYLADPAAVMDAVQRLRRRARSAGRLVTTPQEIVRTEPAPTRPEELITIEAPGPEVVYVPVCDPSFAYGSWPFPGFPPFFPLFAGATINGCGWISGPIVAPFFGFAILDFHKRHIEIDRRRLALFDRDRDRERDRGHGLREEWRHDPGHRGAVPYRNAAAAAQFGGGTPAANGNPALRGHWTGQSRIGGPVPASAPQDERRPGMEAPPLAGGRPLPERIRASGEGGRPATADVQPRFGGAEPALQGVDPAGRRTRLGPSAGAQPRLGGAEPSLQGVDPAESSSPPGQSLNPDAETRMRIEQGLFGRVAPTALAAPLSGRAPPSLRSMGSLRSLGDRRSFRPLGGVGAQPFGVRGPGGGGAQPFSGRGPQTPSGGLGAGGSRGGG